MTPGDEVDLWLGLFALFLGGLTLRRVGKRMLQS